MSTESNSLLFLKCLERYEKQCYEITNRNALIEIFCLDVIPMLAESEIITSLRDEWRDQRNLLNQRVQKTETLALKETIDAFRKVKAAIGNSDNEIIKQKISLIKDLITGQKKMYGSPLYRFLYSELKQLFHLLLESGYKDLCKNYAKLATHKKYVQKDPNQKERWVLVLDGGRKSKILNAEELGEARKNKAYNLLEIPPDYELIDETYIEEFFFAPSVIDAYAAMDAIHWDQLRDLAVVWWYFEGALWCWQTPEVHFEQDLIQNNRKDLDKHFQTICEKSTWQEIAIVKESPETKSSPVIFTNDFFKSGLTTIINEISVYLSRGKKASSKSILSPKQSVIFFELKLNGNELWAIVTYENKATNKFYIQKFHEGPDVDGSQIYQFVKSIFKDPQAGKKKAKLFLKWESVSKHLNRIRLPDALKRAFFEKTSKFAFHFNGIRIALKSSDNETINILNELRKNHLKSEF